MLGDCSAKYLNKIVPSFRNVTPLFLIMDGGSMLVQLANQIPNDSIGVILKASFRKFMRQLKFLHQHPESSNEINNNCVLQIFEGYPKQLYKTIREHTPAPVIICELLFRPGSKTETRVSINICLKRLSETN